MADNKPVIPPSLEDIANTSNAQQGTGSFDDAGFGASIDFAGKDIDRYISYGTSVYGKHGYDPFRDNSAFYNQNTTAGHDIQRAFDGMWKLAGVGFKDTFGFGAFASDDAHKEFDQVMSTYGSTRAGTGGFIANTMLSSGYTVGIMTAIAAEELLLAGATALTGGMGTPVTVGEMVGVGVRGASLLSRAQRGVRAMDKVVDAVNIFKNVENSRMLWAGKQIKGFGKQLMPLGETFDFVRNADKLKDLNGLQKSLQGAGAFARDMRKIHMTMAESKLEANLAKDELRESLINEWYANPANVGQSLSDEQLTEIDAKAQKAYDMTYKGNIALIYATNAITFDAMFKSMRATNRMFGLHESLQYTVRKAPGNRVAIDAVEDTFGNLVKKKVSQITWKGSAKKLLSNSMEGVQEIGQDQISGTAKRFAGENDKLEGKFWDSFYDALGDMHGESFLSGMLMGTFASPVGMSIQAVNQFTMGGGYRSLTNPNEYQAEKENRYETAKKKAQILEDFFNESGSFSDFASTPLFSQALSAEKMVEAGENGNRKEFEDKRAESFRTGLQTLMETGMEQELIDYLEDLGNYNAQELNQALRRTDITEDNRGDFLIRANNYKENIKKYKERYDRVQREIVNPVAIKSLSAEDPEFLEKKVLYNATEKLKTEMLFSEDRIEELKTRQEALYKDITTDKFSTTALNTILSQQEISSEIKSLQDEIQSDKDYDVNTDETAKKQKKLDALKAMQTALKKYDKLGTDIDETEAVFDEMFEAFNSYYNLTTGHENTVGTRFANKQDFQKFWDYLNLRGESEVLQEYVNSMLDPAGRIKHIQRIKGQIEDQEKNKKALIEKSLKAFYEKESSDEMITKLLEEGIVFNHNELDDLIERGVMPTKFFDVVTHKEITGDKLRIAQEYVSGFYEGLTGKKITAEKGYLTRKKSSKDTRTSQRLMEQYGGKKGVPLKTFVSKLKRSKRLGATEKEVLDTITRSGALADVNVITTDAGVSPIDITDNGDILIDVRFASEDYEGGDISFEYMGISALLQTYFTQQMKSNTDMKSAVESFMSDVKDAVLDMEGENLNRQTINNIPVFNNPAVFLSESLNNAAFQNLLRQVENSSDAEGGSISEALRDRIVSDLGGKFDGTMLNRAVDLAYMTLTDEQIDEVIGEDVVEEVIPTAPVGETTPTERKENQIKELETKLQGYKDELSKTKRIQARKYFGLKDSIKKAEMELEDLNQELADLKEAEVVKSENPIQAGHEVSQPVETKTDGDGNAVIDGQTPFLQLPKELQVTLAQIYNTNRSIEEAPESGKITTSNIGAGGMTANTDFDSAENIGLNPDDVIDQLSDEDIESIQANMQGDIAYIEAIGQFNNKATKPIKAEVPVEDTEEEVEVEEEETTQMTQADLIAAVPDIDKLMSERKIKNRLAKLNKMTSQEEVAQFLEGIVREVAKLRMTAEAKQVQEQMEEDLEKLEDMEERAQNYRDNKKILESGRFTHNQKDFTIPKGDIPLFLAQYPRALWQESTEFLRQLSEFKDNVTFYSKSMKTNPVQWDSTAKKDIQDVLSVMRENQTLSGRTVAILNAQLRDEKSPYTIKRVTRRGDVSYVVQKRKGEYTEPKSKSKQLEEALGNWFTRFGEDVLTTTQAEYMIYDWLRENKVHPDALPVKERKAFTSSTSEFTSPDGIADRIFDNVQQEQIERQGIEARNIVEDVLLQFNKLSDFREYLTQEMEREQRDEQGDPFGFGVDEVSPELVDMQLEAEALAEYYKSNAYLIVNNGFVGDVSTLTAEERNLYDFMQAVNAAKEKQLEKRGAELYDQLKTSVLDKTQYEYTWNVRNALMKADLKDTLAIYKLVNNPRNNLTTPQRSLLLSLATRQLQSPENIGKVVATEDGVFQILESTNESMTLQRLHDGKVVKMNSRDFAESALSVLEPGTEYDPSGLDTTVDQDNADDLSAAIGDIFDNLGELNEFGGMNETTLLNSITEELNKCK